MDPSSLPRSSGAVNLFYGRYCRPLRWIFFWFEGHDLNIAFADTKTRRSTLKWKYFYLYSILFTVSTRQLWCYIISSVQHRQPYKETDRQSIKKERKYSKDELYQVERERERGRERFRDIRNSIYQKPDDGNHPD